MKWAGSPLNFDDSCGNVFFFMSSDSAPKLRTITKNVSSVLPGFERRGDRPVSNQQVMIASKDLAIRGNIWRL